MRVTHVQPCDPNSGKDETHIAKESDAYEMAMVVYTV